MVHLRDVVVTDGSIKENKFWVKILYSQHHMKWLKPSFEKHQILAV